MLDGLIQQFAGGDAQLLEGSQLHGGVAQMLQSAPNEHVIGAIESALGSLGGGGFGQSVQEGTANATPEQRSGP